MVSHNPGFVGSAGVMSLTVATVTFFNSSLSVFKEMTCSLLYWSGLLLWKHVIDCLCDAIKHTVYYTDNATAYMDV